MTIDNEILGYLGSRPEMTLKITSLLVLNHIQEIISICIRGLRIKGLSHLQIGDIFKIGKGQVFKLEKKEYFPKKEAKQIELLKTALDNL